jgi:predicted small metal-binding protein
MGEVDMKRFACGDIVPGCDATFLSESDEELLAEVARHADHDHGMSEVPAAMVEQVRSRIVLA